MPEFFQSFVFFFSFSVFQIACFLSCSLHNVQFSSDRSFCWHFARAVVQFSCFFLRCLSYTHTIACTRIVCARGETNVQFRYWNVCSWSETRAVDLYPFHCPSRIQLNVNRTVAATHAKMCVESQRARQAYSSIAMLFTFYGGIFAYRLSFRFVLLAMFSESFSIGNFQSAVFYLWDICRCCSVHLCVLLFLPTNFSSKRIESVCAIQRKAEKLAGIYLLFKWMGFPHESIQIHRAIE